MVTDAIGVLDAHGISVAHLVGVSAGGAVAQILALEFPDRVRSIVPISTTAVTPNEHDLPGPTDEFREFVSTATVDWADAESVIDYVVGYLRVLSGGRRPFDESGRRALVRRDVERADNVASLQNHDELGEDDRSYAPLSSIRAATLVIHGTADPMFPPEHAEALAAEIPGARLLLLPDAGHGVEPADRDTIVAAIVEHTARTSRN
jgi:pimeloyl-ACP methyl ester carboxylesterase